MRTAISFSLLLSLFATVASFASNATGLGSLSGGDGRYTSSTCLSSALPIFADGFESGDSSNWTAQVPCGSDGAACLEQAGSIDFPSETGRVGISGPYAYTTGYDFLRVVDISDPTYPIELGSLEGMYGNFEVAGKYLYATHHDPADWGFRVVDISNSTSPVEIGSLFFGEFPMGIALSGNHVFVPTHLKGLRVIDVANPTHPVQVGELDVVGLLSYITTSGNYAYAWHNGGSQGIGLRVIDISDPTTPVPLGLVELGDDPKGLEVSGDYAYVLRDLGDLTVVDVSNPLNPYEVTSIDTGDYPEGLTLSSNFAFVAVTHEGLVVIDLSDPTNPKKVGSQGEALHGSRDVAVSACHAYVPIWLEGLRVIDVSCYQ